MQDAQQLRDVTTAAATRPARLRLHPLQLLDLVLTTVFMACSFAGGMFVSTAVGLFSLAGSALVLLVLLRLGS